MKTSWQFLWDKKWLEMYDSLSSEDQGQVLAAPTGATAAKLAVAAHVYAEKVEKLITNRRGNKLPKKHRIS